MGDLLWKHKPRTKVYLLYLKSHVKDKKGHLYAWTPSKKVYKAFLKERCPEMFHSKIMEIDDEDEWKDFTHQFQYMFLQKQQFESDGKNYVIHASESEYHKFERFLEDIYGRLLTLNLQAEYQLNEDVCKVVLPLTKVTLPECNWSHFSSQLMNGFRGLQNLPFELPNSLNTLDIFTMMYRGTFIPIDQNESVELNEIEELVRHPKWSNHAHRVDDRPLPKYKFQKGDTE